LHTRLKICNKLSLKTPPPAKCDDLTLVFSMTLCIMPLPGSQPKKPSDDLDCCCWDWKPEVPIILCSVFIGYVLSTGTPVTSPCTVPTVHSNRLSHLWHKKVKSFPSHKAHRVVLICFLSSQPDTSLHC